MDFDINPTFIRTYRKTKEIINSINSNKQIDAGKRVIENFKNYWVSKGFSLVIMDNVYVYELNLYIKDKIKLLTPSNHENPNNQKN